MRIELLGEFAVESNGDRIDARRWRLRKARLLVIALALEPAQRLHRDKVLERLWPGVDPSSANHNLHQALYVARKAIGESGILTVRDENVLLNAGGEVAVDVVEFERAAEAALVTGDERDLRAALAAYRGDLAPDLAYTDWLEGRRASARETWHAVLLRMAGLKLAGAAFDEANLYFTRVLSADPYNEAAVRGTMSVLAATGRVPEALARYERLRDDLRELSGADPDATTKGLFRRLLHGAAAGERQPVPAHLPPELSSFVGRNRELTEVGTLLGRTRLLTLTGAGGCGKTRLAVEAARAVSGNYPGGVWFADLAALREPALVADAIAAALDLTPGAGPDQVRSLVEQLGDRSCLIVLDNCEQVVHGCARVCTTVLACCPGARILATSREPLRVEGEVTFRVPSLRIPESTGDPERLADFESVRLFVERAASVRPGFGLGTGNAEAIAGLCRRLDGMPLALELAAARIALLEPGEILARLGDALTVLGTGTFGATRHQTLRAALQWSYDLLDADERVLLRRLSVFAGLFSLDAAEVIGGAAPLGKNRVLAVLGRLVDKSLAHREPSEQGTRYRLLDTVRQFAAEVLREAGERHATAAAHCAYFLDVAGRNDPEHVAGVIRENPRLLDHDHDNFRAALRWSLAADPASALTMAARLWRYWFLRGHAVEGAGWLEKALTAAPAPSTTRARALIGLTGLDARRGRADRLLREGKEAVTLVERLAGADVIERYRLVYATLVWGTFDVTEAERIAEGVRERAAEPALRAGAVWLAGMCALSKEDATAARPLFEECLALVETLDPGGPAFLPVITPCIQLVPVGNRWVPSFEESLLVGRRVGAEQAEAYVLGALGYAARLEHRLALATATVRRSVERFGALGDDLGRAHGLHHLGCVLRDAGIFAEAEDRFAEALAIRHWLGDRRGELLTRANVAFSWAAAGDAARGRAAARDCLAAFEVAEDVPGIAGALGLLANIELSEGKFLAAKELYAEAVRRFGDQSWPRIEGWYRLLVAELAAECGEKAEAAGQLRDAEARFGRQRCALAERRVGALREALEGS
ncbi:BTAD domain-containing putative transcriptional regulator [Saccharomonospora sp. NPDC006951]